MMLNLERMLRRSRATIEDVECFYYDPKLPVQKGGLAKHPCLDKLWFGERDDDLVSRLQQIEQFQDVKGLVEELNKMQVLWETGVRAPLDERVKYVRVGGRRYPVYRCGGTQVADPQSMQDVLKLAQDLTRTIRTIHNKHHVLWNIHPETIYHNPQTNNYMFGPNIIPYIRKAAFPQPDEKPTPLLMGSTIPSPFQILIDMLASRYENEEMEYTEFKEKFTFFWGRMLPNEYKHTLDVCQLYHSLKNGTTHYIDNLLCKWCIIHKRKIQKNPTMLVRPNMFYMVDWFAFGITLDAFIERVMKKQASATPPQTVVDAIIVCIQGKSPE